MTAATTRGRKMLVVAQVALAVTVVAAAGLLIRSLLRLESVDLGLAADRLVLLELHVPPSKHGDSERHGQFLDAVMAGFTAQPDVSSVTPVNVPPFSDQGWDLPRFVGEGQSAEQAAANPSLNLESIHPNYFETFQVPIRRGRPFETADREGKTQVAVVSDDLATRIWPGQDPIGRRIRMGDGRAPGPWSFTVVGVAAATRYRSVAEPKPTLYLPAAQFQMTATMLVVRTSASLDRLASLTRDVVRSIDPDVRVMKVTTFGELLKIPLARPRMNTVILAVFGTAALMLSMAGLHAMLAASVRHRHREIALRMALGANAAAVRRLILSEAIGLTSVGAAVGVAGAAAAAGLVRHLLFELAPYDPLVLTAAVVLLLVAAMAASYLPMRRATRVDPASMLRG